MSTTPFHFSFSQCSSDIFLIELGNPSFNVNFAIANNVDASTGLDHEYYLNVTSCSTWVCRAWSLYSVFDSPSRSAGYTIEFVAIANINQVFASTPSFSVGATVTTSNSGSTPSTTTSGTSTTTGAITSAQAGVTT
jgi:hypothetical protein